jgi:hypothetical protein
MCSTLVTVHFMLGFTAVFAEFSARRTLDLLHDQIGTAGLTAAAAIPALTAVVDQHAAAVRDILAVGVEGSAAVAGAVLLAGYARGLMDQGRRMGWHPPSHDGLWDWTHADWLTARLVAVCALASSTTGPRTESHLDIPDPCL